ncbi:hypothetical protein [Acinetobacter baumannii]|uniref:hypothetical protein n=1 Tax=Acinetobacter baumannii TaxID=470 RepID=UPI003B431C1D
MDNYKIKVKDEAESKEAQELFFELGYRWNHNGQKYFKVSSGEILAYSRGVLFQCGDDTGKELTLPQLRDLVVLKRNDVKDATHEDQYGDKWLYLDERHYVYLNYQWSLPTGEFLERYELKPIEKSHTQDPALISGADALRALIDGHEVQGRLENQVQWTDINPKSDDTLVKSFLTEKNRIGIRCYFRFKPQTIKLELELPKPFEPKEDGYVYIIDDYQVSGYRKYYFEVEDNKELSFIGVWRTEEEIKQVVEQLRKIRGAS